jgi:hypothetical protein
MNQLNLKGVITSLMRKMMGLGLFITAAFMFTWTASAQPYLDNGGNPDLWMRRRSEMHRQLTMLF